MNERLNILHCEMAVIEEIIFEMALGDQVIFFQIEVSFTGKKAHKPNIRGELILFMKSIVFNIS
jgi:hypothetical protein